MFYTLGPSGVRFYAEAIGLISEVGSTLVSCGGPHPRGSPKQLGTRLPRDASDLPTESTKTVLVCTTVIGRWSGRERPLLIRQKCGGCGVMLPMRS